MALLTQVRHALDSPQVQQLASCLRRVEKPLLTVLGMRQPGKEANRWGRIRNSN